MRPTISCRPIASPVLAGALVALLAFCGTANASSPYTTFTTATAFDSAVPGAMSYGFPSGGGDDGQVEPRGYTDGPLSFGSLQWQTRPYLYDDGGYGAGVPYLAIEGPDGVNAVSDPEVNGDLYAVAFDLGTYAGPDTITLALSTAAVPYGYDTVETFQTSSGVGTTTFIGVISASPIYHISLTTQDGSELDIIDFQIGQVIAPVPEPASVSMALAGLGLLGVAARRRKGAAA